MADPVITHSRNTQVTEHDKDVENMSTDQLREELVALRNAVRLHREERGHDRCWIDDGRLYGALPEQKGAVSQLPPWSEFQANCRRFWELRQCGSSPASSGTSEEKQA